MSKNGFAHLFVIGILAILGIVIFYIFKSQQQLNTSPIVSDNSNLPEAGESGLLAYSEGHRALPGGGVIGGDLWIINPETLEKNKITTDSSIAWVHDWSPDGTHIVVVTNEKRDSVISSIAVIELNTGNIKELKEVGSGVRGKMFWDSNSEIVYLRSDIPNDKTLSTISIDDKSQQNLIVLPDELTNDPQFSPDKQWVAAGDSFFESGKIYSFDKKNKIKNTLTDDEAQFGGWLSNKIIYSTRNDSNNGIWEVDAEGKSRRKLVDLGQAETPYITTSADGSKIVYVSAIVIDGRTNQKLYSYEYGSGEISTPYVEVDTPGGISGLKVSKNGKYASYYQSSFGIKIVNLDTGKVVDICNDVYCDASWSQ